MTRINLGIPVEKLSDKHLLAEHREIIRIPNEINLGKADLENIPKQFTMGKDHVRFFYDKLLYLHNRYEQIYQECFKRGFVVKDYYESFMMHPENEWLINDYEPTTEDIKKVKVHLKEKNPDYYGEL